MNKKEQTLAMFNSKICGSEVYQHKLSVASMLR
jgi:hypothetical protein